MCGHFLFTIFLSILFLAASTQEVNSDGTVVKVKVKQGWVSGIRDQWQNNKVVYKFINVPYALPPLGERRFKDPEPIKHWEGTWDATIKETYNLVDCVSYKHIPRGHNKVVGREDCLYLRIYTPRLPTPGNSTKLLDVIVYIHGGAFMFGSMKDYTPASLMSRHDLVFVKMNYRLGPLGFLSTGDPVVPGNMGLKDQAEALRWIKENIAQFSGNPDSITIAGSSAGGASVHFHMLSPQSKGLFHRAISMSGTMLSPWAISENLPEKSRKVARYVGCPESPSKTMVNCLRNRPATYLANAVQLMLPFLYNPFSPWGPTVDRFAPHPVLPDFPAILIKQENISDVPWLNSICDAEGLYPGAEFLGVEDLMSNINLNWTSLAPHILDFNFTLESQVKEKVAAKIRYNYFKDEPISLKNYKPFIQMIGDRLFNVGAERSSRYMSKKMKSPVYFYKFNFRGRFSLSNIFSMSKANYGISHSDDVIYIAQFLPQILIDTTKEEEDTMNFMSNLWASFAAKGKPHISNWTPVVREARNSFSYLQIDSGTNQTMHKDVEGIGSISFWDSLPFREYTIWPSKIKRSTKIIKKMRDMVLNGLIKMFSPKN